MQPTHIAQAFEAYGINPGSIDPPQSGYRNKVYRAQQGNQQYNLIMYKNEPGILSKVKQADRFSSYLAEQGLPVRTVLDQRILRFSAFVGQPAKSQYARLYNVLPGSTISWEAYSMNHLKTLGWALARLHKEAQGLPHRGEPYIHSQCQDQLRAMINYFSDSGVTAALRLKLRLKLSASGLLKFKNILSASGKQHLLHMDFVRGNILFRQPAASQQLFTIGNVQLSGILDFEKISYGSPAYDLARTLAFLLVDCKYKTAAQIRKYFLRSGYVKRGDQKLPPTTWLSNLVLYFLVYDFYKFLKHNPYEHLVNNEHFMRTTDLLLKNKVLQVES